MLSDVTDQGPEFNRRSRYVLWRNDPYPRGTGEVKTESSGRPLMFLTFVVAK